MSALQTGTPVNLSASGAVTLAPTQLLGFYVNSTTSGIINFKDGGASGTTISGSITPSAGWNAFPCSFSTSAYLTLVSGSINVTCFVQG
jgi:hypothetical protein